MGEIIGKNFQLQTQTEHFKPLIKTKCNPHVQVGVDFHILILCLCFSSLFARLLRPCARNRCRKRSQVVDPYAKRFVLRTNAFEAQCIYKYSFR